MSNESSFCLSIHPHSELLPTHTSSGDPPTLVGRSGSISGHLLLSLESWCTQDFVCVLQKWSICFSQSCRNLVIKSHKPSKSDSLGISSLFARSPGFEAWHEAQHIHNSGRTTLMLLFSRCLHLSYHLLQLH